MKKNIKLNNWLWKWHFIAGLVSLPFVLILSITGGIYLFKQQYEEPVYKSIKEVVIEKESISFQEQWEIVNKNAKIKPNSMVLPVHKNEATKFISGMFGGATSLYVNPYKGEVSGQIIPQTSFMYKVRKLHGELLLGTYGTKLVELVASWMIVLIITGLYVWWPIKGWSLKGFFIVRRKEGKRTLFRDLHAVTSFWISVFLLVILAGGLPWTDVFGANFKWFQQVTNTGYPTTWQGNTLHSIKNDKALTLDEMINVARSLNLEGEVTIYFPKNQEDVFSVSNSTTNLQSQKKYHFDQYSGDQILRHDWQDVGVLMRARMWLMSFHQGEFGLWNWILMIFMAGTLILASVSALVSYLMRKQKGFWGVPDVPGTFRTGIAVHIIIIALGIIFPLFGLSVLLIVAYEIFTLLKRRKLEAI
ncbi:PepSY domain-containing protein [Reichenbachiella sp. MALMAid0571]|uniref:PepSY-associated TM helix domain-containing protein n=1 Tax=Reichenbachiella sp. MALMAid0571 TaxID=3143939 RepID=UPI0032DEDA20